MEGDLDLGGARPHVLLFPFPTQGHVNPFVDIGRRLAALGVVSTLVLTPGLFEQQRRERGPRLLRFSALHLPPEVDAMLSTPRVFEAAHELRSPLRSWL
jgi:UDP:flavonoid glycosyltransferase YjiC (YdhE family)